MIHPDAYQSLGELLTDALVQWKSEPALVEVQRRREAARLSYRDVRDAAMQIAAYFERTGLQAGDRVAILMGNQSKWLISAYAALYRGAVLVPLDYKLTAHEQAALLAHAKPKVLVVESPLLQRFSAEERAQLPQLLVTEAPEAAELGPGAQRYEDCATPDRVPTLVPRSRQDVACIVYSSGTGGRPKGCMLTHDCYLEQYRVLSAMYPMGPGDRYFSILPTNHAIDFMCGFIGPLCGGAAVVHQRTLRPEFIRHTMRSYGVTHMALVPLLLEAFERTIREQLETRAPALRRAFDLLSGLNEALTRKAPNVALSRRLLKPVHDAFGGKLKLLFCGGAFVDRSRAEYFYRLGLPVAIGYGLTEACTVATVNDLKPFRGDSVGRPVDGIELRIEAPDSQGVGQVLLRGRTVMSGYLDDPELTAETVVDGWLRTGDLGWLDASGHLHLVGRSKNMIVTPGGKNVYPEDVEATFADVPCAELAVYGSNFLFPSGDLADDSLVAVVRLQPGVAPDQAAGAQQPAHSQAEHDLFALFRERNGRLPDWKRIRGIVTLEQEFPRTASMKLRRDELATRIRSSVDRGAVRPL